MTYVLVRLSVVRPDAFAPIRVTLLVLLELDSALRLSALRPDTFVPIWVTLVILPGLALAHPLVQLWCHSTTRRLCTTFLTPCVIGNAILQFLCSNLRFAIVVLRISFCICSFAFVVLQFLFCKRRFSVVVLKLQKALQTKSPRSPYR